VVEEAFLGRKACGMDRAAAWIPASDAQSRGFNAVDTARAGDRLKTRPAAVTVNDILEAASRARRQARYGSSRASASATCSPCGRCAGTG